LFNHKQFFYAFCGLLKLEINELVIIIVTKKKNIKDQESTESSEVSIAIFFFKDTVKGKPADNKPLNKQE
jgi:hypothetical protein